MTDNDLGRQLDGLLGGGAGAGTGRLLSTLLDALGSHVGGNPLSGLLDQLHDGGLGEKARSWVSTGANEPVSGPELARALPYQVLEHVAQRAGSSPEEAADKLAQALPDAVDKLTPGGEVPEGSLDELIGRQQPG